MRHRDKETREVKIEERRYDKAGQEVVTNCQWEDKGMSIPSVDSICGLEDASLSPLQAGFGSSYNTEDADPDNPYAWAQRLREIPDKVSWHSSKPLMGLGRAVGSLFCLLLLSKGCQCWGSYNILPIAFSGCSA